MQPEGICARRHICEVTSENVFELVTHQPFAIFDEDYVTFTLCLLGVLTGYIARWLSIDSDLIALR